MSNLIVRDIIGFSSNNNTVNIPSGSSLEVQDSLEVNNILTIPVWDDDTRPQLPEIGYIGFNNSIKDVEIWNGSRWVPFTDANSGSEASSTFTLFNFTDFNNTTGLNLVSTDGVSNGNLFVTNATGNNVGNVWTSSATTYNRSFELVWNFECSGGSGADGFCIQWHNQNNVNGGAGGGCGRVSSTSNINSIVFATYAPVVGLSWYKSNIFQGSRQTNAISWRQNVYFWLDYDHNQQVCYIFYSTANTKPSTANHTLTSFVFDGSQYYFGFGAATGGATDNHILKSMRLSFI